MSMWSLYKMLWFQTVLTGSPVAEQNPKIRPVPASGANLLPSLSLLQYSVYIRINSLFPASLLPCYHHGPDTEHPGIY